MLKLIQTSKSIFQQQEKYEENKFIHKDSLNQLLIFNKPVKNTQKQINKRQFPLSMNQYFKIWPYQYLRSKNCFQSGYNSVYFTVKLGEKFDANGYFQIGLQQINNSQEQESQLTIQSLDSLEGKENLPKYNQVLENLEISNDKTKCGSCKKFSLKKTKRKCNWYCDLCKHKFSSSENSFFCGCLQDGYDMCQNCYDFFGTSFNLQRVFDQLVEKGTQFNKYTEHVFEKKFKFVVDFFLKKFQIYELQSADCSNFDIPLMDLQKSLASNFFNQDFNFQEFDQQNLVFEQNIDDGTYYIKIFTSLSDFFIKMQG
ncbi:hypothetical protein PPERSA_08598 [Pseudocohnilembus persalinus]|uniref:Uncharacterized protein n=1 Tax=Pseudocohnilembus persalinus TaxID=266149 RepID=A0A0V0R1J5_PSEPJ|nr:hypothetical protein PPERSA_08598 [Pseudocohnilembus persalinus]|eukprot:KRX08399.1 hypothetical protein PPERSA_08598 [Pseudocohnilembus persalinus]